MNNENFDNKIKTKLDSLEPAFQEQDWQNFSPLLHPKKPFWLRFRIPLALGVATTTLFFLIYQNRQLSIENKELHHKVENIVEKETPITESMGIKAIEPEKANIVENNTINTIDNQSIIQDFEKSTHGIIAENVNTIRKENSSTTSKEIAKEKNNDILKIHAENKVLRPTVNEELPKLEENNIKNLSQTNQPNENVIEQAQNSKVVNFSNETTNNSTDEKALESTGLKKLRPFESLDFLEYQKFVQSSNPKGIVGTPEKVAIAPKMIKPKPDFYRYGVGFNSTLREGGFTGALAISYQATKRFQLSSGVQFTAIKGGKFKDHFEYKKRFKSDFKDKFSKPFSKDTFFKDIHSRKTEISIPLSINYQFPIWKHLSFFTEIGTALTLQSRESFDYKFSENGTNFQKAEDRLSVNTKHDIIQNAMIAAGLQYQQNHLQLRLASSYQFDFRRQNDFDSMGLKLQAIYLISGIK